MSSPWTITNHPSGSAAQRIQAVGTRVIGAVLNAVDMSKSYNRDYYYGRFYYGSYYGEEGAESGDSTHRGSARKFHRAPSSGTKDRRS